MGTKVQLSLPVQLDRLEYSANCSTVPPSATLGRRHFVCIEPVGDRAKRAALGPLRGDPRYDSLTQLARSSQPLPALKPFPPNLDLVT